MKIIKEKKINTAFLLVTIFFSLMVPISAYQITSGTCSLLTNAGTATIRGGLYTTSGRPEPYNADTTTSISIGIGRTT